MTNTTTDNEQVTEYKRERRDQYLAWVTRTKPSAILGISWDAAWDNRTAHYKALLADRAEDDQAILEVIWRQGQRIEQLESLMEGIEVPDE